MEIDAKDVKRLREELKKLKPDSPEWARKFAKINRDAGDVIAAEAQSRAASSGRRQLEAAAGQVKGSSSQAGIKLRVSSTGDIPYALAAFWGLDRRTGWYAAERYAQSSGMQFAPWVGAGWEVGGPGGPYALNAAIAAKRDEVLDAWGDAVGELMDELNI